MAQNGTTATTDPVEAIAAALGRLGQATPAEIAADAGVAYSTTNKKLRVLAEAGRAQKFTTDDNRTLWRLAGPDTGDATATSPARADLAGADPVPTVPGEPDTGGAHAAPAEADDDGQPQQTGTDDRPEEAATETVASVPTDPTEAAQPVAGVEDATDTAGDGEHEPAGTDQQLAPPASGAEGKSTRGAVTASPAQPEPAASAKPRRASGTLDGAVLDILEAHPQLGYKVSELCKLIDAANQGTDTAKASPGAVVLAAQRLARKGKAVLAVEKPATFQLAPAGD
jgi:hypothetical protein